MRGHSQHPKGLFRQYLCQKRTWMRFVAVFAIGYYAWVGYQETVGAEYPTDLLPEVARDLLVAFLIALNFFFSWFIDPLLESAMWVPPWAWAGLVLAMVGFACATGREAWLVLFLNLKSIWIMIQARRKKFPPDDRHTYYGRHLNL